jgi:mRNA interferase RelE/StbE
MAADPPLHHLRLAGETAALIRGLHPDIKKKIRSGLEAMSRNPEVGKLLKQELAGLRSYRVGRFRIVYRIAPKGVLEIVAVGPRQTIYHETYRLLLRTPR